MQTRKLSSMRGASVVGVVLLLALLSTAAITLDRAPLEFGTQSQVAATNVATPTDKCEIGYDYVVKLNDKGVATIYVEDKNTPFKHLSSSESASGNRCPNRPGNPTDSIAGRSCQANEPLAWYCRVAACQTTTRKTVVDGKTQDKEVEVCYRPDKKIPAGGELNAEKELNDARRDAATRLQSGSLSSSDSANAEEFVKTGTYQGSDSLLGTFTDARQRKEEELRAADQARASAAAGVTNQKKEYDAWCGGVIETINSTIGDDYCGNQRKRIAEAEQRLAEESARYEKLSAEAQRLRGLESRLIPSENCVPGMPGCSNLPKPPEGPPRTDSQDRPDTTFRYGDSDAYRFLDANTRSRAELEYACRYQNNYQACMAISSGGGMGGYGAYGAYGAYPGQQQCGAQNMGGGLIGTIVSLFNKNNNNNNNCVNGVPRPQCTITASPQNIATGGQAVQLTWQSQDAFSASLSNAGGVPPQGSMTVNPQTTTTYNLFVQGYRDNYGQQASGQCSVQVTVGQQGGPGGPGGGGTDPNAAPKAQISCSPLQADVGMSVAISFACQNSVTSGGTGFSTNGQLSGSATPVVQAPTLGSDNKVTYGLTCSKEGKTDTAQCTVNVSKPSIVLVANPKNVKSGEEANIGWVTGGMDECVISSPTLAGFTAENANNTSVSGVAKTPALTQDTKFVLTCTTQSGGTKTAETTVEVD